MEVKTEKNYEEWVKKAEDDFVSLQSILKHRDGAPATGCFLAQQTVEKFLKALIIFKCLEPDKTHDLIKLINTIETLVPEIKDFSDEIATLNRYYIETRYPGDYPEFTWDECQGAFESANKIRGFIIKNITG